MVNIEARVKDIRDNNVEFSCPLQIQTQSRVNLKIVHNIYLNGNMFYSITWLLKKTASLEKRIGKGQVTLKTEKEINY